MSVTYKSTTGVPVNAGNYVVTANPGLQLENAVDVLDKLVGISLSRTNTSGLSLVSKVEEITASIPVIIPNSSTVATNGAITLTALPTTYSNGAWVYLPSGAVVGGSAGLYWTIFSSTTAGVVKTNYVAPASAEFIPYVPAGTPVTAVGSNSAYVTPTGSDLALVNITLPANTLTPGSNIKTFSVVTCLNDADDKIVKHTLGSTAIGTQTLTTSTGGTLSTIVFSRTNAKQVINSYGDSAVSETSFGTVNTAAASKITITGQLEAVTSALILEAFTVSQVIS